MEITVHVELGPDDTLAYTPDAAAMQVLVALGGDATKDFCTITSATSREPGTAGVAPVQPPPAE
jgi:hypothetical protein